MSEPEYDKGGVIDSGPVPAVIAADECVLRPVDEAPGLWACHRHHTPPPTGHAALYV